MGIKLVLFRHAHAGSRAKYMLAEGRADRFRPLSSKGKREMKAVLRNLKESLYEIDLILTSPYTRAKQTARILQKQFGEARYLEVKELQPFVSAKSTMSHLRKINRLSVVALVGHEPHLSRLLSFILTGATHTDFDIKKSGFAIVEFADKIEVKQARLMCLVQPPRAKKIKK